ncbi:uncharacterized protein LOC142329807 isoform X2 [Lycorma delicatula]|uniref:uncharacterized protein LOC142329807 isoform X2 n=1 Tax=Lycorma delicatula TaxID=130591 RepID=UPI003F50E06A
MLKMENDSISFVHGRCLTMCPEEEINMRVKNGLIHILETERIENVHSKTYSSSEFDPKLVVKCFQRSAAGVNLCNSKNLRHPDVLLKTVNYLLTDVIVDDRLPWNEVYDFICDRLRAVRQDLVIQQPPAQVSLKILEPIVRFHVYSAYRLCGVPLIEFDPKLNIDQLKICLEQIFVLYSNVKEFCDNREEMEALYQIIYLGNNDAVLRGFKLPEKYLRYDLKIAMDMSVAWYRRNYFTVLKKLKLLSPLLQAAAVIFKLPDIRRSVLEVMSVAYSCKNSSYPLEYLAKLLLYDSMTTAEEDCIYYNIKVSNAHIVFLKSSFDSSKQVIGRRLKCVTEAVDSIAVSQLLLNCSTREY